MAFSSYPTKLDWKPKFWNPLKSTNLGFNFIKSLIFFLKSFFGVNDNVSPLGGIFTLKFNLENPDDNP
jgi:hypothetical protein